MREASGCVARQPTALEVGPIRPPSEANSLLLRITRNCPWNRCAFCSLYRGEQFSVRPVAEVIADIETIRAWVDRLEDLSSLPGDTRRRELAVLQRGRSHAEQTALHLALNWLRGGMRSVFLQDANSLVMPPADLVVILEHLREVFPAIERVTSYARSHSVARIGEADLDRLAAAGLNRIHIGLESGADQVLRLVNKGVTREIHVQAGQKIKQAGIELSEYVMPGLGGKELSTVHASETAAALNRIDPDFIRIRTLAIARGTELENLVRDGRFAPLNDREVAVELLNFLERLTGISSEVQSDHILNLFQEINGQLPRDREQMTAPLRAFLAMPAKEQLLFIVGRRTGIFSALADHEAADLRRHAERAVAAYGVTPANLDRWTAAMMQRFI